MRSLAIVSAALALFTAVSAAPSQVKTVQKVKGGAKPSSYIVKLKDGVSKEAQLAWLAETYADADITHPEWQSNIVNGFAGILPSDAVDALLSSPDVDSVAEDGVVTVTAVQNDAPWGLQRISQAESLAGQDWSALNFTYTYDDSAGSGVDIYIVDTGIYLEHTEFEGRAKWGTTFGNYSNTDLFGHGTHVSGTAAGSKFGVAKKANLIAVKVLGDDGNGYTSDVISGLNWVVQAAASSGRPSIASMSLTGFAYSDEAVPMDNAVIGAVKQGIHVAVAAGNYALEAGLLTPARVATAVTVGASDINDARAYFSDFGAGVDIFAPGLNVTSSWIGSPDAVRVLNGTSMATPHVSGLIATIISRDGNSSPAAMSDKIKRLATRNVISDLPKYSFNGLARNEV